MRSFTTAWFISACLALAAAASAADKPSTVTQKSTGNNSPNINGNENSVKYTTIISVDNEKDAGNFAEEFPVTMVVELATGTPIAVYGFDRNPFSTDTLVVPGQPIFAGIAHTVRVQPGPHGEISLPPKGSLLVDYPQKGQEESYRLDMIQFALLREVGTIGGIGTWVARTIGTDSVTKMGVGEKSPLSQPRVIASTEALKMFQSNRFARGFVDSIGLNWRIPRDAKLSLTEKEDPVPERRIDIDLKGVFHAGIIIQPLGSVDGAVPPGFDLKGFPRERVSTKSYHVMVEYSFAKKIRSESAREYKKWLDTICRNIREGYADRSAVSNR